MALVVTHSFVSPKSDSTDTSLVRPSNWNASHTITGTVDETMLSLADITTANVSTAHHGLTPKLPNDATLFLDGTGSWTAPAGSDSTASYTWTGVNRFSNRLQVGSLPSCDNAQMTVYQTMDGTTNSSMADFVANANGTMTDVVNGLFLTQALGTISGTMTGIYLRNDLNPGSTTTTAQSLRIDAPAMNGGAAPTNIYGLVIENQTGATTQNFNLYSKGGSSRNVMEGVLGIGEVAPQAPLHISHDTTTNTQGVGIRLNAVSGGAGAGLGILWTDNADVLQMAQISGQDDDNWGGRLVFMTAPQTSSSPGGTPTERMRINSSGVITFNNAYHFPTAAGSTGQVLVTDSSGNLTWTSPTGSTPATVVIAAYTQGVTSSPYTDPNSGAVITIDGSNNIIFSNIPQTYRNLRLEVEAATTTSGYQSYCQVNNDTASHYLNQISQTLVDSNNPGPNTVGPIPFFVFAVLGGPTEMGYSVSKFGAYTSNLWKPFFSTQFTTDSMINEFGGGTGPGYGVGQQTVWGQWQQTDPIHTISVNLNSQTFVAGSTFVLIGEH